MIEGYQITTKRNELDLDSIHQYLSQSYWAKGVSKEVVNKTIENSVCFGVIHKSQQVGFARVITDSATFAYLADIYILENHRSKGLSKWLVQEIMAHSDLQGLRRMMLATRDAHGLYEKFGFTALANPQVFMELCKSDVDAGA